MYDEPVAVPIIDLLDSNMMSQYIGAAREQYNQAVQDQKEFAKEFGELYGPNANVNKEFYDITRGAVNKGLDYLYQNGIDPLRSAEGRSYIAKIIRERPYAEIANLKAQNESMKTYQRYRAEAMRNGTYDPDFEKFALGGKTLETWDPSTDGMWTREAPSKYSSLKDWTSNLFDNMQLEYDPELTKQAGGLYQVYSKSPKKMQQILDANIKDMTKSDLGRYYLNMYGGDIDALKTDIINRNREYTQVDRRADQVKVRLNNQQFQANEAAKQRAFQKEMAKQRHEWDTQELEQNSANKNAQAAKGNGKGSKGKGSKQNYNLVADVITQASSTLQNYFATHTFGEKNYGNNFGYLYRAQGNAFSDKGFNLNDVSFDLPRGGYSAWIGVQKNKLNSTFGYSYNANEVKGKIFTEDELRTKASTIKTGRTVYRTYTDRMYKKHNILGVAPVESSRNGIAIVGKDGRMHLYQKVTVYTTDGTYRDSDNNKYKMVDGKWTNITTDEEVEDTDEGKALTKSLKKQRGYYSAYQELPAGDVSFTKKSYTTQKDKNGKTIRKVVNRGKVIPGTEWYDNGGKVTIDSYDISTHSSKWANINKNYNQYYK